MSKTHERNDVWSQLRTISFSHPILKLALLSMMAAVGPTLVLLSACSKENGSGLNAGETPAGSGWRQVWSDEFDGESINSKNWLLKNVKWPHSGELQFYTPRKENVRIENGKLVIEARRENYSGAEYTSGRLYTQGLHSFQYGKIAARIKLPSGKGVWPAFWALGRDHKESAAEDAAKATGTVGWPQCGEIDIMEFNGNIPNKSTAALHANVKGGTTHVFNDGANNLPAGNFSDDFHVFAIEWEQDVIRWYVDDRLFLTKTAKDFTGEWAFNKPFYLILNLAIGGAQTDYTGKVPPEPSTFPKKMEIDWVRVYAKDQGKGSGGGSVNPPKAPTPPPSPEGAQICKTDPRVNQSLPYVYDALCKSGGTGCIEDLPCRYGSL